MENNKMQCFVKYLDCKNNFKVTKKDFKDYKTAWAWVLKNFEKPNADFINYYY